MLFKFIKSLNFAIEGILHAARTQRHIRYHLFAALLLLLACFVLGINREEFIILTVIATMVIVAEIINSAIEEIVNLVCPRKNEKARVIKDMAAGAVLVVSGVAILVGYFLISPYVRFYMKHGVSVAKHTSPDIAMSAVIIVLILVIVIKAYTGKGLPLRGGMPSGHSAFVFSVWTAITFSIKLWFISLPVLVIAIVIAASRVVMKIHSVMEVIAGAILGTAVTLILYRLFY